MAADPPLMLMDEPFGAIDPITRERLQNDFLRLHRELRKTVVFVTHDIDEAIKMGDRVCILRQGGVLAQYDTPEAILAAPADEFVAQFVGADRGLKRLALRRLDEVTLLPVPAGNGGAPETSSKTTLRDALSLMLTEGSTGVVVRRRGRLADGLHDVRRRQPAALGHGGRAGHMTLTLFAQEGPVIPDFGRGDECIRENGNFCAKWFVDNFTDRFWPRVVEHIELTVIALVIGFVIAFVMALVAYRYTRFELPFANVSALFYTIPSIALFQILVPITGIGRLHHRDRAGLLHAADPVPQHAHRAQRGAR